MGVLSAVSTKESYADLELPRVKGRRGGCISKSSKEGAARCGKSGDLHIDKIDTRSGNKELYYLAVFCREGEYFLEACR